MEAPEGRGRITPLPPPEPDGIGRPVERAPRQWMPVGLALAGLIAFAVWLASTGTPVLDEVGAGGSQSTLAPLSAEDTAPQSTITTPPPTTTAPPTLGELLPWLDGSLLIFSGDADGDFLSVWDESLPKPQEFRLSGSNVIQVEPEPATLNFVAYETAGRVASLYLGGWQKQEPIFVGTRGFAWDPAGSATLLFVGTDQITGDTALYRQRVTEPIELVTQLADGTRLIGWTEAGLITAVEAGPAVSLVDQTTGAVTVRAPTFTELRTVGGELLARVAAVPLRTSPNGTIIAVGTAEAFDASSLEIEPAVLLVPDDVVVLDASEGAFTPRTVPIPEVMADGELIFSPDGRWSLSNSGDWVARTTDAGIATAIAMRSLVSQAVRVMSLQSDGDKHTVGFSQDGEWFFTYSNQSDQLIASSDGGAQFTVPFQRNVRLEGVYIRP